MSQHRVWRFCVRGVQRTVFGSRHSYSPFSTVSHSFKICTDLQAKHHIRLPRLSPLLSCAYSTSPAPDSAGKQDFPQHQQQQQYDPKKGKLIYAGTVSSMVKAIKIFSLSTSAIGLAMQPFILSNADKLPAVLRVVLVGTVSFFVVLTPLLLHWITGRYVTQMHYDALSATYTANTYSLFVTTKEHRFTLMDVEHLELPGLLTTIKVNKKPLFFDPDLFIDKKACVKLLGYDQPINWTYPAEDDKKKL